MASAKSDKPIIHCSRTATGCRKRSTASPEKRQGHEQQQNGVGEGRKNAGAAIAEGSLGIGGALRPMRRNPGDQDGGNIGKIMNRVAEQSNGMTQITTQKFGSDQDRAWPAAPQTEIREPALCASAHWGRECTCIETILLHSCGHVRSMCVDRWRQRLNTVRRFRRITF